MATRHRSKVLKTGELEVADKGIVRVWANGCFDVFHFGHANFLRQAKTMGNYVIAGVHGDVDITNNKARPVLGEQERARIIMSVKWVDEIRGNVPYGDVLKILNKNSCDFCVHGDDIATDASGRDIYAECKAAGRFKECKRTEGISTTLIIDRILLGAGGGLCCSDPPHAVNGKEHALEMSKEYYEEIMKDFSSSCSASAVPKGDCKIAYSQGVFDLFHSGHVDFLEKCTAEDVFVVVGVLSDDEVYRVYGNYPVTNTYERALALMSCKFVDRVEIGVPFEVTVALLDRLKVDYVYHGKLWELPRDPYLAAKEKKIFYKLDSGNDTTTSTIIQRVIDNRQMYSERNSRKPESQLSKMVSKTT